MVLGEKRKDKIVVRGNWESGADRTLHTPKRGWPLVH